MSLKTTLTTIILFLSLWLHHSLCHAFHEDHTPNDDLEIQKIFQYFKQKPHLSRSQRLEYISEAWLNKPYLLFALGEGQNAEFDQHPLYRTDAFDCETFVDTVLALTLSQDLDEFKLTMNKIRYQNGQVDFLQRNHFTGLQWNTSNQQQGFIQDITPSITHNKKRIYLISQTSINKGGWYNNLSANRIYLPNSTDEQKAIQYEKLKSLGRSQETAISEVTYLPLTKLFDAQGHIHHDILNQIPNGAIMEIVRPQWNIEKQIGTQLDISHLGFLIYKKNTIYFRNASSRHQKVIDQKLEDYLVKCLKSPTIKGIHIEKIF
jgi:Protein of unknown function (DUF1460)